METRTTTPATTPTIRVEVGKVLTVKEVANYLKVHPSTIYRLLYKRSIPAFKIGSDWRFELNSIDKWVMDRMQNNA